MKRRIHIHLGLLFFVLLCISSCADESSVNQGKGIKPMETGIDWPMYGGNSAGNRYSPLDQITLDNVQDLEVAWTYMAAEENSTRNNGIQCQPIVVDGILYGVGLEIKLFALDAATGEEIWEFDPGFLSNKTRGVMYWTDGTEKRILYSVGPNLYAINAETGKLFTDFGNNGIVDLHLGLGDNQDKDLSKSGIASSSPGIIYKNTVIMGSSMMESGKAPPGHIRAFDVITGALKWVFHTIPQPGELGYDTWPKDAYKEIGAANNWSGFTMDESRGIVYFGTGSPASDFYGGNREGDNLFANCILALEAETGDLRWYYQTIHHDLWDRDIPCPPNLTTINHNGKEIDVVVQATKDGLVYVLDRDTGESIFPVEERQVPTNGLPGESPSKTQRYPVKPLPLSTQVFTEDDITNISPESHAYIKEQFMKYRTDHKFTPPSLNGTLLFGYSGGAEWGGNAVDTDGVLYVNSNNDPWVLEMVSQEEKMEQIKGASTGKSLYDVQCAACHGLNKKGDGSVMPDISGISDRMSKEEIIELLEQGKGRMPSFASLTLKERGMITDYLLGLEETKGDPIANERKNERDVRNGESSIFGFTPKYVAKTWQRLLDQEGYPGVKPPWGTLNAIDLNTGDYLWSVPLGEYPELTKRGIPITGTENYGGPIVTASGLIFIAGTKDERIRAFDKNTGKVVWEHQLPAGGFATPITYMSNGKQYIVIAAGGGRGQKIGGKYVAFALP